jgi:aryl-alcohol dehydrogenase-like predicted oxidoreductase
MLSQMQYRYLGRTGLKVSVLCLGTMQFGWSVSETDTYPVLDAAYAAGINFFDTADIYSFWAENNPGGVSETYLGKWWRQQNIPRHKLVLATKVRGKMGDGPNEEGLSRVHIMHACEQSLKRLQTDYIDLYQAHWLDDNTPIEETLRAFDDLIKQGKVRYVGCSNYPAWRLMQALWTSEKANLARFDSLQPHYSLVHRAEYERELMEVCTTYGLGVIPYSALAAGFLSGKYRAGQPLPDSVRQGAIAQYLTPQNFALLDQIDLLAAKYEKSVSQIALAWSIQQPAVVAPVIGARTIAQLEDNLGAIGCALNGDELALLDKASCW